MSQQSKIDLIKCACHNCICVLKPADGVKGESDKLCCSEECAQGHPNGQNCPCGNGCSCA